MPLMFVILGFVPAFQTAVTTDGLLTLFDYVSMFGGFLLCDITRKS